ncbi:MAG: transposase, partial [Smithella sp.]
MADALSPGRLQRQRLLRQGNFRNGDQDCLNRVWIRDGKFVYQRQEKRFNGESFGDFLKQLRKASCQAKRKVYVILDNATYHHARVHKQWRELCSKSFALLFLPAYSPDLNPIERVWKLTRRLSVHNRYFPELSDVVK